MTEGFDNFIPVTVPLNGVDLAIIPVTEPLPRVGLAINSSDSAFDLSGFENLFQ